jgi:hypothetical protein
MSDATADTAAAASVASDSATPTPSSGCTSQVAVADIEAHIAKVKAAWRKHESAMSWEQKIAAIERMWERTAQLERARELMPPP